MASFIGRLREKSSAKQREDPRENYQKRREEMRENAEKKRQEKQRNHEERMRKMNEEHQEKMKKLNEHNSQNAKNYANKREEHMKNSVGKEAYPRGEDYTPGFCFIICNSSKTKHADELSRIFLRLGFAVRLEENDDADRMRNLLRRTSRNRFEDYDCFVLIIISSGSPESVIFRNGGSIDLEYIIDLFNPYNVIDLAQKPKLLLFQCYLEHNVMHCWENEDLQLEPNYEDAIALCSTHKEFLSKFTNALKTSPEKEVSEILDLITDELLSTSNGGEGLIAASTLQKKFYLKPQRCERN